MTTMVVEIYDALRSIGVAEDKAAKAAEAMATLEPQFAALRSDLQALDTRQGADMAAARSEMQTEFAAVRSEMQTEFAAVRSEMQTEFAAVRSEMRTEFAAVRSEMRLLKWQVGLLYAITGPTLALLLRVAVKVGALG